MRELLAPEAVLPRLEATSKKQVLQDMAAHAAAVVGLDSHSVIDVLWEREKLGTTGIGSGIAIPHGRVPGLQTVRGFFCRLAAPVAYESVDDRPVDLIFLLLAPEQAGADHLHALAMVSRLLRSAKLCEELRNAKDQAALYRLLTDAAAAEAA